MPRRLRATAAALASIAGVAGAGEAMAAPNCAGPQSETWINITIDNVRNDSGLMAVTLYADEPRKFLVRHGSMYVGRVDAAAPETKMCLFVPKPGVYAIAVYHDEDGSGKINRGGMLGIPTEGFGFSNNPATIASLPSFRSVRLHIAKTNLSTRITLKYP
ncbi:DUF2141 domain-containing protein [Novosphingobium sp. KCTC 2891]|uniref:DUF2141 domain-containing protein n=1 Tax=Novosphingobium sp. KCTC 2891 TaxID=2989730 RepID=UPI002222E186|nr:DUF2141 domain-containing protein [Novosphingobium sp. KCTC 2891]